MDWVWLDKANPNTNSYASQQCTRQQQEHAKWFSILNDPQAFTDSPSAENGDKAKRDEPNWCDLAAQQSMADSTATMVAATVIMSLLTFFGVGLLWYTLSLTRKTLNEAANTTKAAEETARAAHKYGKIESASYVMMDGALYNCDKYGIYLNFTLRNIGKTSARRVNVRGNIRFFYSDGFIDKEKLIPNFKIVGTKFDAWSGVIEPANDVNTYTMISHTEFDRDIFDKHIHKNTSAEILCYVSWEDIHGEGHGERHIMNSSENSEVVSPYKHAGKVVRLSVRYSGQPIDRDNNED